MIFTSRTYRHAIRRSIKAEKELHQLWKQAKTSNGKLWFGNQLHTQINHTRRLQARKRKERK